MPLPTPERGLVISYAYLWDHEHRHGLEEGRKDRPCVIVVVAVEDDDKGRCRVTVVPVTHSAPSMPDAAVEIPLHTKQRLGLDDSRSWIVVTEANDFVWPGSDLRPLADDRFDYDFLPPRLFEQVQKCFRAYADAQRLRIVPRTE